MIGRSLGNKEGSRISGCKELSGVDCRKKTHEQVLSFVSSMWPVRAFPLLEKLWNESPSMPAVLLAQTPATAVWPPRRGDGPDWSAVPACL